MRKAIRTGFWIFGAAVLLVLAAAVYWQARLPDEYALTRGGSLRLPGNITAVYGEETAVARSGEATAEAQLRLPLGVSVKTVSVRYVQRDTVLVSGRPFGIKMFTEGLMVVGFTDFSADGRRINPARSAGLATGDILLSLDGITLTSNEQMGALVQGSGHAGQNMVIRVTDEALLQKTGGILQGMSGSPLVQNGMLVGAVTHVFVDEPDRGYAIFAETVRNAEKNLDQTTRNAA